MAEKPAQEGKKCPECDSKNFKSIEKHYGTKDASNSGGVQTVTTRYKCQRCLETWKETVPV